MSKGYSKTIILMFWLKDIQQQVKWFFDWNIFNNKLKED